jgi:uncharacterized protein YkwD
MVHPRPIRFLIAFSVIWAGGCPLPTGADDTSTPPGRIGFNPADNADPVGPPADSGDDAGAVDTGGDLPPAAVGGDSSGPPPAPDELTVIFPGCEDPAEGAVWKDEVLQLVNAERAARGVAPVVWNDTLADQATQYACELIAYDFFDHVNPSTGSTLGTRTADFGYDFWIVGENLAAGQRTPAEVVADWMNSPCHRQNVINPAFTELGIGIRIGGDYGLYWVQEFGRPFALGDPGASFHDPDCHHDE